MNSRFYYAYPPDVVSPDRLFRDDFNPVNNYANSIPEQYLDAHRVRSQYYAPHPNQPYAQAPAVNRTQGTSILPAGTILHKGFYDLLALIPTTATASRFLWGTAQDDETISGPRYENVAAQVNRADQAQIDRRTPVSPPLQRTTSPIPPVNSLKKIRRISKDMVSKPTGFVHLVHASDADQAEALLTRWGPDGIGKLGDPRWAGPIKNRIREIRLAKAVNDVVNALNPSVDSTASNIKPALRVVNGMSSTTASTITPTIPAPGRMPQGIFDGLPGSSTAAARAMGPLVTHVVHEEEGDFAAYDKALPEVPRRRRTQIVPSLQTLERAVAAKIYFENLYFPLLRHPPSREQRRLAMEREMELLRLNEAHRQDLRARWRQNESDYLRERRQKVDVSAFVKLKTIGHGAFGVVSLVREKSSKQLFAMKQLRKTDMLRKGQEAHVRAERDILKSAALVNSPGGDDWIVKLFYSFQDRDHLYLVLEYMGGGDLLNLLIERDVFDEDFARFYVAEMVLSIESCHKHGFIHRDIKPDNFLFDPQGHIKLSDFGLATDLHWAHDTSYYEQQRRDLLHKYGIDLDDGNEVSNGYKTKRMRRKDVDRLMGGENGEGVFTWRERNRKKLAYSVCGTNSYMSPEVIRGHGYTFTCDWWSLGVIMFECLYGYPPFVSNSRHVTRQKILNWKQSLRFPSRPQVSHHGVDLMKQMLCEPEDRLGSQTSSSTNRPNSIVMHARRSAFIPGVHTTGSVDGAEKIKAHPWFRGIDWVNIRRYPAPFKPDLSNPEDTRHFEADIPAEPLAPANGAPADATKDPLLRDKVHGEEILNIRKALAFTGFTHKSPRAITYVRADKAFGGTVDRARGRSAFRTPSELNRMRAMSL